MNLTSKHIAPRGKTILLLSALLALLPACTSTHIKSKPFAGAQTLAPVRQVMVIGMDSAQGVRLPFENRVVTFLTERGVQATASHTRFSFDDLKGDKVQLRHQIQAAGADSVLIVRVADRTDFGDGPPPGLGSLDVGAVDESRFNAFTTPGGNMNTDLLFNARLYRVSDGEVLWHAQIDKVIKEDADQLNAIRDLAKTIVRQLSKDHVIP